VTIISTIGYGHVSPVTWEGQIVCICYAVVGLPIFGVFLTLLGDLLAEWFLKGYRKFAKKFLSCQICSASDYDDDDDRTLPPSSAGFTSPDLKSPFSPQEAKSNDPELLSQRVGRDDSAASAVTLHQIWPLGDGGGDAGKAAQLYDNPKHFARMDTFESFRSGSSFNERMDVDAEGKPDMEAAMNVEDEEDEGDEEEEVTVPLTVSVSLMAAYLGLGALTFVTFEGWSAMEGAYFSFITLSTIGFGDFVPGSNANALGMLCAAIYIMFGMALLAMCFNLMQEKVVRKLKWIVKRCKRTKEE